MDPRIYGPAFYKINHLGPQHLKGRLAPALKKAGYETLSVVPYDREFYNSENIHRSLGIEKVIDCKEMKFDDCSGNATTWVANDAFIYSKVLDLLKRQDSPKFILALTMANHYPHGEGNIETDGCAPGAAMEKCLVLKDYMQREMKVKQQVLDFNKALTTVAPNSIVIYFGDHIPSTLAEVFAPSEFLDSEVDVTVAFGYDAATGQYFSPSAIPELCRDRKARINIADLDVLTLKRAGFDSAYIKAKLDKIAGSLCQRN